MKKLNGVIIAVAAAAGLSVAAIAGAQMQPRGAGPNANPNAGQYECPMYNDGACWQGQGRGYHRGMRGHHRGWNGGAGYQGGPMGPGMMGPGMGGGFGSYFPRDYMVSLVTPAEVAAYRNELRTATSVEACQQVDAAHRKLVGERAAAMNVKAPEPRFDVCVEMEKNGWYAR